MLRARFAPLAVAAAVLLATACSAPPEPAKVVIVGVDGATFSVIDPLVAAGELPNFAHLLATGTRGTLRAQGALVSPPIWTTVATGHLPRDHGIRSFFYQGADGGRVLVDTSRRKVGALWNWMGPLDRTVGVAGWWASWPAERVEGWMVSDRFARSQWSVWPGGVEQERLTWPRELADELAPFVLPPDAPPMDELAALADFTPEELARLAELTEPRLHEGLSDLKFGYLAQRTYEEATLHLIAERGQPDLTAVFLIATDPVSHRYWHLYQPEAFAGVDAGGVEVDGVVDGEIDPDAVRRLGGLVPAMYRHADGFLGRLLATLDEGTVVFVVSDHGFQPSGDLSTSGDHHRDGIVIAAGGPVRNFAGIEMRMVDLAPTILRTMQLPVPRDLPGRVVEGFFTADFLRDTEQRTAATFASFYDGPESPSGDGPGDREMTELLRSLGYL